MTREEAIEELKAILEMDYKNVPLSKAALDMAIKALEQEQIDKVFSKTDIDSIIKAVNEGWELRVNEVLDKIRTEILEYINDLDIANEICGVFDKYKTDSEPQESEEI